MRIGNTSSFVFVVRRLKSKGGMNLYQKLAVLLVVAVVAQADHHINEQYGGGGGGGGGQGGPGDQQGPGDGDDGDDQQIIDYGGLKPGICPVEEGDFGICGGTPCQGDEDCPGDDKCCPRSCGKLCMPPQPIPGQEPEPLEPGSPQGPAVDLETHLGACAAEHGGQPSCGGAKCSHDGDCAFNEKCCHAAACGEQSVCMPAIHIDPRPVIPKKRPSLQCPIIGPIDLGNCDGQACVTDSDCFDTEKCCGSACGYHCTPAVAVGTPPTPSCDGDLVFNEYGPVCEETCTVGRPPFCPDITLPGCSCPAGTIRVNPGSTTCVAPQDCPSEDPKQGSCTGDLVFNNCAVRCQQTCSQPEVQPCTKECARGCFCPSGMLRESLDSDRCYANLTECPPPQTVVDTQTTAEPAVTCEGDLVFSDCGSACEQTCENPEPLVCIQVCAPGCVCPSGQLRVSSASTSCVQEDQCPTPEPAPRPCEEERVKKLGLVGAFVPQCTPDGLYAPTQCHSSTGYCWCADIATGAVVNNTEVQFTQPECPPLPELPDPAVLNQCPEGRVFADGVKKCVLDIQCSGDLEAHECTSICDPYCNQPEGILCATLCVPGCRCPPGTIKLAQDSDQCVPESQCPDLGTGAPTTVDITVDIQCSGALEAHECTSICDPYCNQPEDILCATLCVPGCRCPPGTIKLAQDSDQCVPESQCPVPVCGEGYKLNENQTDCIVQKPCPVLLAEAKEGGILIGEFVPSCEVDGSYSLMQCHGSTGYCWCVNTETGVKHPGTDIRGRPDCASFLIVQSAEATTAVPDVQTDSPTCPDGQVHMECGTACPADCNQSGPVLCIAMCVSGCFCPSGLILLDSNSNVCIAPEDCPAPPTRNPPTEEPETQPPTPPQPECEGNLEFTSCGTACPLVCGQPEPQFCTFQCVIGCACPSGMYLEAEGSTTCVAKEDCPFTCPAKIGTCPFLQNADFDCTEQCKDDYDCEGERKCCPHTCGSVCYYPNFPVPQPYPIPGPSPTSPPPEGITVQSCPASDYVATSCDSLCASDSDCALSEMCCDNTGCGGSICVSPVSAQMCTTVACPIFAATTPVDIEQKLCGSDYNFIVKVRPDGRAKILDDLKFNTNPYSSSRPIVAFDMDSKCTSNLEAEERYFIFVSGPKVNLQGKNKYITLDHTVLILPMTGHRKSELNNLKTYCPIA